MQQPFLQPRINTIICLGLLFAGLVLDLSTTQRLVIAITYNIPIALSGLALSRRLTLWLLLLAILANIAAAYVNSQQAASYDQISLLNRGLASLSFLLVALMTLAFHRASTSLQRYSELEKTLAQERALRELLITLSRASSRSSLLSQTVSLLHPFLAAEAVHLIGLRDNTFTSPHFKSPEHSSRIKLGASASWATQALPLSTPAVISIRDEEGLITVGRIVLDADAQLLIIVHRPKVATCSRLLGSFLEGLIPLLERLTPGNTQDRYTDAANPVN